MNRDRNIKIAKELVKLAKNLVGAIDGPIQYSHQFKNCGIVIYHRNVYKSDFPMGYGKKKYQWSINRQNKDSFTPEECIVVNIRNNHQDERQKLIENSSRFDKIGMESVYALNQKNVNIVFQAIYVGDYTEKRLNDVVALISEIFGEEPLI